MGVIKREKSDFVWHQFAFRHDKVLFRKGRGSPSSGGHRRKKYIEDNTDNIRGGVRGFSLSRRLRRVAHLMNTAF